jgi:hypothetical protein
MAMGQDEADEDPLLKAIGEFRLELTQWIEDRIATLREQDADQPPSTRADDPEPRPRPAEPIEANPTGDSRNRLDLLARHLNDRLRGSEAARAGAGVLARERADRPSDR